MKYILVTLSFLTVLYYFSSSLLNETGLNGLLRFEIHDKYCVSNFLLSFVYIILVVFNKHDLPLYVKIIICASLVFQLFLLNFMYTVNLVD